MARCEPGAVSIAPNLARRHPVLAGASRAFLLPPHGERGPFHGTTPVLHQAGISQIADATGPTFSVIQKDEGAAP
jgi:hypothetical protein